jgi:hypothetical protein
VLSKMIKGFLSGLAEFIRLASIAVFFGVWIYLCIIEHYLSAGEITVLAVGSLLFMVSCFAIAYLIDLFVWP